MRPKICFPFMKKIENIKKMFDENFSFPAFVVVLACMISLFWTTYKAAFQENITGAYYLALIISGCISLSFHLLIMVSASIINEISERTRCTFHGLPYRHLAHKEELKNMLKKDFQHRVNLTLWNIYVVDKLLIITSLGTLLTYGILLGSLGNNTSRRNE